MKDVLGIELERVFVISVNVQVQKLIKLNLFEPIL